MWQNFLQNLFNKHMSLKPLYWDQDKRLIWTSTRSLLENNTYKRKKYGRKSKSRWPLFVHLAHTFGLILKTLKLYQRGHRNAKNYKGKGKKGEKKLRNIRAMARWRFLQCKHMAWPYFYKI